MARRSNKRQEKPKSGEFYTSRHSSWVKDMASGRFLDPELMRIVTFYLFQTPCGDISTMARDIQSHYGWIDPWRPWRKSELRRRLLGALSEDYRLRQTRYKDDMVGPLSEAGLLDGFPAKEDLQKGLEKICIYVDRSNIFMSIFSHIRNAFAHGRFAIHDGRKGQEPIYIFEDIGPGKKNPSPGERELREVRARMIIRQGTLLKWIDIIEAGPYREGELEAQIRMF